MIDLCAPCRNVLEIPVCRIARVRPIIVLVVLLLAACGGVSPEEQTLEAHQNGQSTQMHDLRMTATVGAERLMITLEYAETRIARAHSQQENILATLEARDIDTSILPEAATLPPVPPTATENPNPAPKATEVVVDSPVPVLEVTPFATATPSPFPTLAEPELLQLRDIVMATGVGVDDCATEVTNRFSPDAERIYVVARAVDIAAGSVLTSQWFREGVLLTTFDYMPDFVIENACVWFFADQTDFEFTPGSYSVNLLVNGEAAAPSIPFTITNGASSP
jgi:hypothetical protein